jgi:predicted O-linked N-acetylglucosamine transferase (SPINDLY family)
MSKVLPEKLRNAFRRFQARDLAGAERLCGEVLSEAPRHPDALHLLGVVRLAGGNAGEAVTLINQALEGRSRDAAMLENLGVAHLALRNFTAAEALFREAFALGAANGSLCMRLGIALSSQGKLAEAVTALREAAARAPGDPDVHLNLGNVLAERGEAEEALACYRRVLALQPDHPAAHFNLGNLHRNAGRLEEAEASYRRVLAVAPNDADVHNNLGLVYERQGRLEEAAASYRQALALAPTHVHALSNAGSVLRRLSQLEAAAASCERALAIQPNFADALINLGNVRAEQGRPGDAQALYERALRLNSRAIDACRNLGRLFLDQGRMEEAISHYRRALELDRGQAHAHVELGIAQLHAGNLDQASACFRSALDMSPDHAGASFNLAETLKVQGKFDEALVSYERALALEPDYAPALGGMVHVRQHVCSWQGIEELWGRVRESIAAGTGGGISPFSVMSMPTSPAEQLACARAWMQQVIAPGFTAQALAFDHSARGERSRLRIGYLSWGFHRHATAYLTAQLFELHDRDRFEVFAYAYGPDDNSVIRARLRSACEHFTDISRESHFAAASRIHNDGVDILVDLTGHTLGARPQILALRPAPVQVNWLGYPGTMGADCVGYLIADPFIIPAGQERFYAEKVIRLPNCYQVSDRLREVRDRVPSRAECGLPADAFVFCCFNQAYKILPETFDRWMRILRGVPGSVLWLAEANRWATENLRRAAAEKGVAAERLVFAPRKDLPEYLVQYRLADLALDTFPYTSHTTASDALWMGCPLVTCPGQTFASRVAGSILVSAGLRDLVTETPEELERLAIGLASSPERLRGVRRRVEEARGSSPLFDTPRFVRELEDVYGKMFASFLERRS